jgi:MSHA biogenesis protein MshL
MGKIISLISIFTLPLIIAGCYTASPPTHPELLSKEARDASASGEIKGFNEQTKNTPPPPMVLPSIYQNISPFSGKTISLSAENANLRQVLYLISQSAGLNLIIDSDVDTNATITITMDKTSTEDALDTVMDLSGCSYTLKNGMLYIKQYTTKTFSIPYIHTQSSFDSTLGGDMLGGGDSGSSSGSVSGKFALSYKNPVESNDFYKQIETNIKELLSPNGKFTLNRFTGTLVVTDTKKALDTIDDMLKKIRKSSSRQVLIEAKILEVTLNDTHELGVDWATLPGALGELTLTQTLGLTGPTAGKMVYNGKNMDAIITALDTAGDVQTLSNPRIKVSSGQSALFTSGQIVPFWDLQVTPGTNVSGVYTPPLYEYTRRDVLDGLSLGVTPKITEDGQIILNIVPVTTSIDGEKSIEGPIDSGSNGATTTSTVATAPIINIKEAGTIIYARDNDLVLIGGLISNVKKNERESIPLLGELPYFGALFSRTHQKDEKHELVILLKLNLVEQ